MTRFRHGVDDNNKEQNANYEEQRRLAKEDAIGYIIMKMGEGNTLGAGDVESDKFRRLLEVLKSDKVTPEEVYDLANQIIRDKMDYH